MKVYDLKQIKASANGAGSALSGQGVTASVSFVTIDGRKYAFKHYNPNADIRMDPSAMEKHVSGLLDDLGIEKYNELTILGAFPKYLVQDNRVFCGFLMDVIPADCYTADKEQRTLGCFLGMSGELEATPYQKLGEFVKYLGTLIFDLHSCGYSLGDVLNDQNIIVRKTNNGNIYPYLIDIDSLCKRNYNPACTYHSPNYIPPEGESARPTKEIDVYKYCLIVLRLFARPRKAYQRASLVLSDDEAKNSLKRIEETMGSDFKACVVSGLSDDPQKRPDIKRFVELFKKATITSISHKISRNDPCPCGSGKKYKDCCGREENSQSSSRVVSNNALPQVEREQVTAKPAGSFQDVSEIERQIEADAKLWEDELKATEVKKKIDAIGPVLLTDATKNRISEARKAYSLLTKDQKALVSVAKLEAAEDKYLELKNSSVSKSSSKSQTKKANTSIPASKNKTKVADFRYPLIIGAVLILIALVAGFFAKMLEKPAGGASKGTDIGDMAVIGVETSEQMSVVKTKEDYLNESIKELNAGISQGKFKQLLFGMDAVYCLNNDGTVTVYPRDNQDYDNIWGYCSDWKDIKNIQVGTDYINRLTSYKEMLIGYTTGGKVLARYDYGDIQDAVKVISIWIFGSEMHPINGALLCITSDGKVVEYEYDADNDVFDRSHIYEPLQGCNKIVSIETKEAMFLGLNSDGKIIEAPMFGGILNVSDYGEKGTPYADWTDIKDIAYCEGSYQLFGLTEDGQVLYGGAFAVGGDYFDASEAADWTDVVSISAGYKHFVALRSDGTVYAVGNNDYGECDVSDWKNIVRVEAYGYATVGYGADGTIYITGYNCLENELNKTKSQTEST